MTTIKRPQKWMTSAEHEAWLKETGQYEAVIERQRAAIEARRREIDKRVEEERIAEAQLVADLCVAGFEVTSIHDLYKVKGSHAKAVPILLSHFSRPYPPAIRDCIARSLAVPEVKAMVWPELLRLFRIEAMGNVKDGLAVAIAELATEQVIGDVLELVRDRRQGDSRLLLLSALNKSKDPRGKQTILDLADEPDLREEIKAIRKKWERNAIKRAQKAAQKNPTRH